MVIYIDLTLFHYLYFYYVRVCAKCNHCQQPQSPSLRSPLTRSEGPDSAQFPHSRTDNFYHLREAPQKMLGAKRQDLITQSQGLEMQTKNGIAVGSKSGHRFCVTCSISYQVLVRH